MADMEKYSWAASGRKIPSAAAMCSVQVITQAYTAALRGPSGNRRKESAFDAAVTRRGGVLKCSTIALKRYLIEIMMLALDVVRMSALKCLAARPSWSVLIHVDT